MGGLIHQEMAFAIKSRGHDYEIAVPFYRTVARSKEPDPFEEGVRVHRIPSGGRFVVDLVNRLGEPVFHFPSFLSFSSSLRRFLRREPPFDVVIAEGAYPMGAMACLATRGSGTPLLVSVAGGDFLANLGADYGYGRYWVPRWLMRRTFRAASVVRAIAPYAGAGAIGLGCPPERLALVPRNIAASTFLPEGESRNRYRKEARRHIADRYDTGDRRLIVTVGRLLPIKGFDHLVRALPSIVASQGDVRLLHVGPNRDDPRLGDYQKHLQGLAQSLGVLSNLLFAGTLPLEGVREALAAADVAAVPSLEEGGNKTMLEAAAVGTPFVVTRTSGNAGWAKEWDCGLIVEPASPSELAQAISHILGDEARGDALGENGLRFAQEFRTSKIADRMLALCQVAAKRADLPEALREPKELLHPPRPPA
jgi:glycosyltransferase involved in cell wall biosynthesis